MSIDTLTALTRTRYNRLAPIYDWLESFMEAFSFRCWREQLWGQVKGQKILEVGVGTGKNTPYYPPQARVTAIDLSNRDVREMDAQRLDLPDGNIAFAGVLLVDLCCSLV